MIVDDCRQIRTQTGAIDYDNIRAPKQARIIERIDVIRQIHAGLYPHKKKPRRWQIVEAAIGLLEERFRDPYEEHERRGG